jgi:succinate dehydrogenase/fumarate reductase-like Fe-S protein
VRVTVLRGPNFAGESSEQSYELPEIDRPSISNVLQYISRHVDGTLAYYLSCRRGMCAACVVRVNGRNAMACVTLATDGMVLEPTQQRLVVKDTVVHLGMPKQLALDVSDAAYRDAATANVPGAEKPQDQPS